MNSVTHNTRPRSPSRQRLGWCATICWLLLFGLSAGLWRPTPSAGQTIDYPPPALQHAIQISARQVHMWPQGLDQIVHLQGQVRVAQGELEITANEALLLIQGQPAALRDAAPGEAFVPETKVVVWAEGLVEVRLPAPPNAARTEPQRIVDSQWLGRLYSQELLDLPEAIIPPPDQPRPEIWQRFQQALGREGTGEPAIVDSEVAGVQFQEDPTARPGPATLGGGDGPVGQMLISPLTGERQYLPPSPIESTQTFRQDNTPPTNPPEGAVGGRNLSIPGGGAGTRMTPGSSVEISARDSQVDFNWQGKKNPQNPSERIWFGTGGVRVDIESPELTQMSGLQGDGGRRLVILADNIVAWQTTQPDGSDQWEIYLEGNVVFSKGTRSIYADQMYYDVERSRGTILNADMLTPMAGYNGLVRLKSQVLEQVDQNQLVAHGAAFTSSRMGVPRYWMQSDSITVTRQPGAVTGLEGGLGGFNSAAGDVGAPEDDYLLESRNNFLYVSDRPVFFWPRYRTLINDPTIYLERIRFANDQIFGFQAHTAWNLNQLLGIRNNDPNQRRLLVLDYLSERGFGFGTERDYTQQTSRWIPGVGEGFVRTWSLRDSGRDNLGRGRTNLVPEEEDRRSVLIRHRQRFEPGFSLRAEVGYLSDRNFLEQFYENRWDTEKDYTSGLWLERNQGTQSFNVLADYQLNEFFTQTSWLPRLDHFQLGQPLFNDRLVWQSHSHAGYGRFRSATPPLNAVELAAFDPLAWEANVTGARVGTRQELSAPFQLGPVKLVPYVLGDVSYWQQDLNQEDLLRGYGQVGLKSTLPFWRVDPTVQSVLWNVNGLAHKVSLESEILWADASQNLDRLPLYDPLDDDAQEHFRQRFVFNTFGIAPGGNVPLPYDERYFAVRSGMQSWVTAPSAEIAEDLAIVRLGANQRWQTKRGLPGRERIIDWITFNTQVSLFPQAARDNFGSDWGMFNYDFRWHLGDRVSLVSDGFADFFSQGLRTASVGMHLGRPESGSVFLGYRMIEGPISSNIINASLTYRMSDKWGVRGNTSVDFGETGTIGNALNLIYIGESFLWRVGANADFSRDNVGFQFGIEPRFLQRPRMFRPGGVAVTPAGSRWLE